MRASFPRLLCVNEPTDGPECDHSDYIERAFMMVANSVAHHIIERDGWACDDECFRGTISEARKIIETHILEQEVLLKRIGETPDLNKPWINEIARVLRRNISVVPDGA